MRTRKEMRRLADALIDPIRVTVPADPEVLFEALVASVGAWRGREVVVHRAAFPPHTASGLWLERESHDDVVVDERAAVWHQIVILCHEVWHMNRRAAAEAGAGDAGGPRPVAARTDFSLARLRHYTGTPVEDVQSFILFTNYHRYVDEFVRWATAQIADPDSPYESLSCAGGVVVTRATDDPEAAIMDAAWRKHQMPAYHLTRPDGQGITLVNIGVGPSNAKTICDHLAVMRPHAWMMIGHCGGLRGSQTIGDYVLAHAYLRDDHVLDAVLPADIPIPSIAEVQRALYDATKQVSGAPGEEVKKRLRTGTVVTTDDRNWELRYSKSALRFNQSRAVAIDMESATIAAQGYRFRVPYGTLLCVSDKPLHGELKLPGMASAFYRRQVNQHLEIGIRALERLRGMPPERLHSRKLRTFMETAFQ